MDGCIYSQDSKTETTGNGDLLLALHVEVPDHEPRQNGKGEISSHEPGCYTLDPDPKTATNGEYSHPTL